MHNGLSFYQTKYCKSTFLALPCLSYILFYRPVVGKKNIITPEVATTPLLLQNFN